MIKVEAPINNPYTIHEGASKVIRGRGAVLWHTAYSTQTLSFVARVRYIHVCKMMSNARTILFKYNSISKWKRQKYHDKN